VPELVGDTGLLADVDDAPALAAAVQHLLSDPAFAAALGRRARCRVVPTFSHQRLVGDIDALYQRLLTPRVLLHAHSKSPIGAR
jgi:glycosyltransferase involved in cell wall biosynthesis